MTWCAGNKRDATTAWTDSPPFPLNPAWRRAGCERTGLEEGVQEAGDQGARSSAPPRIHSRWRSRAARRGLKGMLRSSTAVDIPASCVRSRLTESSTTRTRTPRPRPKKSSRRYRTPYSTLGVHAVLTNRRRKVYSILSDPNLRAVYDKNGAKMVDKEGAMDMDDAAGFFANVFGGERFVDWVRSPTTRALSHRAHTFFRADWRD